MSDTATRDFEGYRVGGMVTLRQIRWYQNQFRKHLREQERRGGIRGARRKAFGKMQPVLSRKPAKQCYQIMQALELVQ